MADSDPRTIFRLLLEERGVKPPARADARTLLHLYIDSHPLPSELPLAMEQALASVGQALEGHDPADSPAEDTT